MKDMINSECLLPKTKQILFEMVESAGFLKDYVLVGGSALSLHLCHRKSEDLDFFTFSDCFDKGAMFQYIRRFKNKEILNENNERIDMLLDGVKVTFFNAAWPFLKPRQIGAFNLATIEVIAGMKVNTLFLRARFRDYYDLYVIANEKMDLKAIFESAQRVVEGITLKLFCMALIYTEDIEDDNIAHLEPRLSLSKEDIGKYFENKIKEL